MAKEVKDVEGQVIKAGDLIRLNFGIPPTTVELFVFGDDLADYLHVIDGKGTISTLDDGIGNNSYVCISKEF